MLSDLYAAARDEENPIKEQKILNRADTVEVSLDFQGANPKHLDFDTLKDHIRTPHENNFGLADNKYKARISSRATAIRSMCVSCQGADTAGVRNCPTATCPLYPFRMGADPLRGWDIPKGIDPELLDEDEADDIGEFEDTDDAD